MEKRTTAVLFSINGTAGRIVPPLPLNIFNVPHDGEVTHFA